MARILLVSFNCRFNAYFNGFFSQAEYIFTNKFDKVTCNVSGKTSIDYFCNITSDNQSYSAVSYGAQFNRLVTDTLVGT